MSITRTLLAGIAAATIATPVLAQACLPAAERAALDVRALQSQLMVVALSCGQHEDYNRFVTRHQRDLGTAYNGVRGYFRRTAGGASQRQLDNYITNLANSHSQEGIRQGSAFCQNAAPMFQQAMAQADAQGLAAMSVSLNIVNPISTPACAAPTVQARRTAPAAKPVRTAQATPAATPAPAAPAVVATPVVATTTVAR